MLACVFVGSVLAGKANPYLSFFSSEMFLIGTWHGNILQRRPGQVFLK